MLHAARLARQVSALPARQYAASLPTRTFASKANKSPPKATSSSRPKPDSPASEQPPATNLSSSESDAASTPAAENAEPTPAAPLPNLNSLDFTSTLADAAIAAPTDGTSGTPGATGEQRTGARSARSSKSSSEKRRGVMGRLALGVFTIGAGFFTYDLGREWSVDEVKAKKWRDDQVPVTRFDRTKVRFKDALGVFSEPQWEELLPAAQPGQKPMTLIISLDDLLVTSTWDRSNGWRTAKRPGVDYFLAYLSQFYEIVIWTTQHHYTAAPILEKLDPYHFFIAYQLFRESTRVEGATIVKDLSYLNRDLSKVVVLDTDPDVVKSHASNSVIIPPWKGTPGDKGLVSLIPFLESIGIYQPDDVRPILDAYRGKDVAIEYAKTEAIAKAEHLEKYKSRGGGANSMTLTGLFSSGSNRPAGAAPPTYLEMKRAEAQAVYRQEQAYIRDHKEEFDRLLEEDRQAQMQGSVMDWITGSKPEGGEAAGASAVAPAK